MSAAKKREEQGKGGQMGEEERDRERESVKNNGRRREGQGKRKGE